MMSGRATPLISFFSVVTFTLSGRSARNAPSAMACDACRPSISVPSAVTPAICTRSAVPRAITQAEPSFLSVPSGASEIRLVSGPPTLVSLVSSTLSGGGVFFSAGRGGGCFGVSFAGDRGLGSGSDLGADSGLGLGLGLDCGRGLGCGLDSGLGLNLGLGLGLVGAIPLSSSQRYLASPQD